MLVPFTERENRVGIWLDSRYPEPV